MDQIWADHVLKSYILMAIFSGYNSLLFFSWAVFVWIKEKRKMSCVFYAIGFLFLAICFLAGLSIYARYLRESDYASWVMLLDGEIWAYRSIPITVIMAGIGFFMTRRWWLSVYFQNQFNRRYRGRRESDIKENL